MGDFEHILAGVFWLILAGLFLKNWQGANAVFNTGLTGGNSIISTLQHP